MQKSEDTNQKLEGYLGPLYFLRGYLKITKHLPVLENRCQETHGF